MLRAFNFYLIYGLTSPCNTAPHISLLNSYILFTSTALETVCLGTKRLPVQQTERTGFMRIIVAQHPERRHREIKDNEKM